jgi:dGTPase
MDIVERQYAFEDAFLSPFATKSKDTKGREREEVPSNNRTEFARDRDRIIHCKAFRRLKHKTQVFLSPEGDHYRTRLTHTLEVSQIARSIARGLALNEDLAEAIALGHDLGHTPYGHAGEDALRTFTSFNHNEQSLRIVDYIEYDFKGINLTFEVRDGILNHTSTGKPATLEGQIVQWSDRIAYINHDIDDAVRGKIIFESDIDQRFLRVLGAKHSQRINSMILDIIQNSSGKNFVSPSPLMQEMILGLRDFLFRTVYNSARAKGEEGKATEMIRFLYSHFYEHFDLIPSAFHQLEASKEQKVCDYISLFTDRYAVKIFKDITVPKNWDE